MATEVASLYWRIGIVMAERGVRTVRELRRRLSDVGFSISEPQLSRVRKQLPKQLDTRLLAALCAALDTHPGELLTVPSAHSRPGATVQADVRAMPSPEQAAQMIQGSAPHPVRGQNTRTTESIRSVAGPKLRPRLLPSQ